jgi:hypothetical protein
VGEVAISLGAGAGAAQAPGTEGGLGIGGDPLDGDCGDLSCMICCEDIGDHVMMPCGHGGYCRACAHKVYVRPPNLCAMCRARLTAVVKVSMDTPVGGRSSVE